MKLQQLFVFSFMIIVPASLMADIVTNGQLLNNSLVAFNLIEKGFKDTEQVRQIQNNLCHISQPDPVACSVYASYIFPFRYDANQQRVALDALIRSDESMRNLPGSIRGNNVLFTQEQSDNAKALLGRINKFIKEQTTNLVWTYNAGCMTQARYNEEKRASNCDNKAVELITCYPDKCGTENPVFDINDASQKACQANSYYCVKWGEHLSYTADIRTNSSKEQKATLYQMAKAAYQYACNTVKVQEACGKIAEVDEKINLLK